MALFTINILKVLPKNDAIVGTIFEDSNTNGTNDTEIGVENVQINLINDETSQIISTRTSNINGVYSFENLQPGFYYIDITSIPNEYSGFTTKNTGSDDTIDSDVDSNGNSDVFELVQGGLITIDAGLIPA